MLDTSGNKVTLLVSGAAVPMTVSSKTQFSGAKSARDLKPGDEVRASFSLTNGTNEVTSISRVSGAGGATGGAPSGSPGSSTSGSSAGGTYGGTPSGSSSHGGY